MGGMGGLEMYGAVQASNISLAPTFSSLPVFFFALIIESKGTDVLIGNRHMNLLPIRLHVIIRCQDRTGPSRAGRPAKRAFTLRQLPESSLARDISDLTFFYFHHVSAVICSLATDC